MSIISEFKKALKIAKKIKEIKQFLDKNAIKKDLQEDITAIKGILDRMANRYTVFKGIWELFIK